MMHTQSHNNMNYLFHLVSRYACVPINPSYFVIRTHVRTIRWYVQFIGFIVGEREREWENTYSQILALLLNVQRMRWNKTYSLYDSANDLFSDFTQSFCAALPIECKINTHYFRNAKTKQRKMVMSCLRGRWGVNNEFLSPVHRFAGIKWRNLSLANFNFQRDFAETFLQHAHARHRPYHAVIATLEFRLNLLLAYFVHLICRKEREAAAARELN